MTNVEDLTPKKLNLKSRLSFLFKDSLLYGGAGALNRLMSFILFPVLAHHFNPAEYGVLDFFMVLAAFLGLLIIFGQDSSLARFFYEKEEKRYRQEIVSQSLVIQIAIIIIVIPVLWILGEIISDVLIQSENTILLFRLILLQAPFLFLVSFSQNLLKWSFKRKEFLIISIGSVFSTVFIILIGIFNYEFRIVEIFYVGIVVNCCFGITGIFLVKEWLIVPRKFEYIKVLTKFAIPLGIVCVAGAFIPLLERGLIDKLLATVDVGIYAAANKIALQLVLVIAAFQTAWGPFSYSLYKSKNAIETYNEVLKGYTLFVLLMVLLISAMGFPLLALLADESFSVGAIVIFPIALGLAIESIGFITELGISIAKRSYLQIYVFMGYLLLTLCLILLLTPPLGLLGVALSVCFGKIFKAVLAGWFAQKYCRMRWQYGSIFISTCLVLISGMLATYFGWIFGLVLGSILFVILFFMMGFILPLILYGRSRVKSFFSTFSVNRFFLVFVNKLKDPNKGG